MRQFHPTYDPQTCLRHHCQLLSCRKYFDNPLSCPVLLYFSVYSSSYLLLFQQFLLHQTHSPNSTILHPLHHRNVSLRRRDLKDHTPPPHHVATISKCWNAHSSRHSYKHLHPTDNPVVATIPIHPYDHSMRHWHKPRHPIHIHSRVPIPK